MNRISVCLIVAALPVIFADVAYSNKDAVPREGLVAWYEPASVISSQENPDGASNGDKPDPVIRWEDRSGNDRHLTQEQESAQPVLIESGPVKFVRFDGVDDCLRNTSLDLPLKSATFVLVVAPQSNNGGFRGFLALNQAQKNDFMTGLTIDQGPIMSPGFHVLNVEGKGFTGANSLRTNRSPFGELTIVEVTIDAESKKIAVTVDGEPEGTRDFDPARFQIDELTLGARFYNFGDGNPLRGFSESDFAEVVIYDRVLADDERTILRDALTKKHAELQQLIVLSTPRSKQTLERVQEPSPVQVFVPGFEVHQLPLTLPNINNIRYRTDGSLIALAYNGNVYILTDSDKDGFEDHFEMFWENNGRIRSPIGMALTPPDYTHGQGVVMATKGEVLLITDTDGDNRADKEITVAKGWNESFHNVDALGVAFDPKDESIYFGLGTANFADPLLKNEQGEPQYELAGERGTILKVAPDFTSREVVSTGIRFPVALAFNALGDLFCTDQEGATWVPNGNPYDELLHIQPDRHYGFPPRNPKHLPNVIDEPSTYDYGPQHQSTCGLTFNTPVVENGPVFGPASWRNDAFVCGYSRGKIYRTSLEKTTKGYVARNTIFATLDKLTVDTCVTPIGDMIVATHSGGPDWGSGPSGEGLLYKILYQDKQAPQPVLTWAAAPDEIRVAFDRPLAIEHLKGIGAETHVTMGKYVRAGDEYETIWPGYDAVARQLLAPRHDLQVSGIQVTPDHRTLVVSTAARAESGWRAIKLPGLGRPERKPPQDAKSPAPQTPLSQYPTVDLDFATTGTTATWNSGESSWQGWLPHLDMSYNREVTTGSAGHDRFWEMQSAAGELTLETKLHLDNMLRPDVQPGSKVDYELPPETIHVLFESNSPIKIVIGDEILSSTETNNAHTVSKSFNTADQSDYPIRIELDSNGDPNLHVSWTTAEDDRPRPFAEHRFLLPWTEAPSESGEIENLKRNIPEIAGGNWGRGRHLFFGEKAMCGRCHTVRGQGEKIGPDLSNLVHRDYASVFRDIEQPSYAVNPDYISHTVVLTSGKIHTGTLQSDGEQIRIGDQEGRKITISREEIQESVPSPKSVMPEELIKKLSDDEFRDLMTYLLTEPPQMPADASEPPPPGRTIEEVNRVLEGAPSTTADHAPIHIVLVAGEKDHGPGEHDYPAWQTTWEKLFSAGENVHVTTAWDWPSPSDFQQADAIVFYQKGTWDPNRARDIDQFLQRGGGLVYIHYAVDGGKDAPDFAQRIGMAWEGGRSKFRHGPLDLGFQTGPGHPIARNFDELKLVDESYWQLVGDPARANIIATGNEDNAPQPLFWTIEPANGRVVVSIPGHYSWTFDDPLFRILILRGIAWSAKQPVDRFNDLVPLGARMSK